MFPSCSTLGGIRTRSTSEIFLSDQISTLKRVKEAGYDTVELYYNHQPDWVKEKIIEKITELELRPYSIHLPKFLLTYKKNEFLENMESIRSLVKETEIQVAVIHPPSDDIIERRFWHQYHETLLEFSEDTRCALAFEIVRYLPNGHLWIAEQIRNHPDENIGVTVDLEFMYMNGLNIQQLFNLFGTRILNIHFRDSDGSLVDEHGKRKYLNPGEGDIDLQSVIRILKENQYNGPITIEVSHKDEMNIINAKKYLDRILSDLI